MFNKIVGWATLVGAAAGYVGPLISSVKPNVGHLITTISAAILAVSKSLVDSNQPKQ